MPTYIVLLRGINVGGIVLPMAELTAILEQLGCTNVKTYIQSGNVVLAHPADDPSSLSSQISAEIRTHRGIDVRVLVLTPSQIEAAMAANPFPQAVSNGSRLHLGFLVAIPKNPDLPAIEKLRIPSESFQLIDRVFYLYAPDGVGGSKLAAGVERLLGVPMTYRNWNTVLKLKEMAGALA